MADLRDAMFTGSKELQAIRVAKLTARLIWQATIGGSHANVMVVTDAGIFLSDPGSFQGAAIDACALLARQFQSIQKRLHATALTTVARPRQTPANALDQVIVFPSESQNDSINTLYLAQVSQWTMENSKKLSTLIWISGFQQEAIIPARRINVGLPDRADLLAEMALNDNWWQRLTLKLQGIQSVFPYWSITLVFLIVMACILWVEEWRARRKLQYLATTGRSGGILPEL